MEFLVFAALLSIVLFAPTPVEERRWTLEQEFTLGSPITRAGDR